MLGGGGGVKMSVALTWSPEAHLRVRHGGGREGRGFQAGGRDWEGPYQVLEGQGRLWGLARSLQSPTARRDWS